MVQFNTFKAQFVNDVLMHFVFREKIVKLQNECMKSVSENTKALRIYSDILATYADSERFNYDFATLYKERFDSVTTVSKDDAIARVTECKKVINEYEEKLDKINSLFEDSESRYKDALNALILDNDSSFMSTEKFKLASFKAYEVANIAPRSRFAMYAIYGGYITPKTALNREDRKKCSNAFITLGHEVWNGLYKADKLHFKAEFLDELVEMLNLRKVEVGESDSDKTKANKKAINAEIAKAIERLNTCIVEA